MIGNMEGASFYAPKITHNITTGYKKGPFKAINKERL